MGDDEFAQPNVLRGDIADTLESIRDKLQQNPNPTKDTLRGTVVAVEKSRIANVKDEVDRILGIIDSDNFNSETVKSDVLKLLDSAIANRAAIGVGGRYRRRGKKTRKPKKARRMTRRRRGGNLFTKSNLAPRPEPGTSNRPGSVAEAEMKRKQLAYDPFGAKAEDALGPKGVGMNAMSTGAEVKFKAGRSKKSRRTRKH